MDNDEIIDKRLDLRNSWTIPELNVMLNEARDDQDKKWEEKQKFYTDSVKADERKVAKQIFAWFRSNFKETQVRKGKNTWLIYREDFIEGEKRFLGDVLD